MTHHDAELERARLREHLEQHPWRTIHEIARHLTGRVDWKAVQRARAVLNGLTRRVEVTPVRVRLPLIGRRGRA